MRPFPASCGYTETSADNHGRVWNTRRNHWGWEHYLGDLYGSASVSKYASPARPESKAARQRLLEEFERVLNAPALSSPASES